MHFSLKVFSVIVIMLYPFLIYFGLQYGGLNFLAISLGVVFLLRIFTCKQIKLEQCKNLTFISASIGITLVLLALILKNSAWFKFYPVGVSATLFIFFTCSLYQNQTIIEKMARLQDPNLPASAIFYTRQVTKVWMAFFLINASISLYTCFLSIEIWSIYNGLISYILIASLFSIEFVVRYFFKRKFSVK